MVGAHIDQGLLPVMCEGSGEMGSHFVLLVYDVVTVADKHEARQIKSCHFTPM